MAHSPLIRITLRATVFCFREEENEEKGFLPELPKTRERMSFLSPYYDELCYNIPRLWEQGNRWLAFQRSQQALTGTTRRFVTKSKGKEVIEWLGQCYKWIEGLSHVDERRATCFDLRLDDNMPLEREKNRGPNRQECDMIYLFALSLLSLLCLSILLVFRGGYSYGVNEGLSFLSRVFSVDFIVSVPACCLSLFPAFTTTWKNFWLKYQTPHV